MTEKFEIKGEWFLPTDKETRVHGVLTFDPQDGTDLELYGSLNGDHFFPEFKDQEIILGLTSDSKQITLQNCFMTESGGATLVSNGESGKPSTKYSIIYLLIGLHGDKIEDLKFTQISSEIFNLGEWVGISGFKHQFDAEKIKNHEITVDYKLPDQIKFDIDDNTKGLFNFVANTPSISRYQKTATISQKVEFQANLTSEKSIDDLLSYIITFQNFLTLSLYKSTYPLSISLSGDRHKNYYENGNIYNKNIKLFFSSRNFKLNDKPQLDLEMIFDYRRIKDNFPTIIKKWYNKYELFEPAFDLVFEQFYNGNRFTVNTFLNLAQSAETFHARVQNHTKMPKEQYKKMKEDILKAVQTEEYQKWLSDQFNFGNNLNLHQRLTELTEKYSNKILDKIIEDKERFVLNVKNSRNYYTHYTKDGEKKALKGGELYYLSERLKILLVCSFLIEIGFDNDSLATFLDKIKYRLFNHLANWRDNEE
jgi:hypothetical protein